MIFQCSVFSPKLHSISWPVGIVLCAISMWWRFITSGWKSSNSVFFGLFFCAGLRTVLSNSTTFQLSIIHTWFNVYSLLKVKQNTHTYTRMHVGRVLGASFEYQWADGFVSVQLLAVLCWRSDFSLGSLLENENFGGFSTHSTGHICGHSGGRSRTV